MWFCGGLALTDHLNPNMLPDEDATIKDGGIDISVVIPSYNHALYIKEAIDSVLGQTVSNWELIVIDDGSTDGTRALLDNAYAGHSQIRLIYQNNQGAHHAINQGMSLAKGRYISILNSDDVYHPERLQTLLTHCETSPCALAFTPLGPIDAQGAPVVDVHHPWCLLYARLVREFSHGGARQALLTGNFAVTTSNFFFRADLLKTLVGFRKKRYNHDWDFMARLVQQGLDIVCVGDKPLMSYRLHGHNTITQNTLMARVELKRILRTLVPADDPYFARLVSRVELNMRSMRREHQVRITNQIRTEYDNHIHVLTETRENLLQQIAALNQHLVEIHNSRSYRFAQHLSRVSQACRRLLGKARPKKNNEP
jgi:glycosyltransferase involved in cell wall biosynthesis